MLVQDEGVPDSQGVVYMQRGLPTVVYPAYNARTSLVLGAAHTVLGALCVALNASAAHVHGTHVWWVGPGFWAGILFIIGGGVGIGAAKRKDLCLISTNLALAIFSCLAACLGIFFSGLSVWFQDVEYGHMPRRQERVAIQVTLAVACGLALAVGVAVCVISGRVCGGAHCSCCCSACYCCQGLPYRTQLIVCTGELKKGATTSLTDQSA